MPAQGACDNLSKIPFTVSYTNMQGGPAVVDGDTQVTIQSGDGSFERTGAHQGFFRSGDVPGDTIFLLEADADLGAGAQVISDIVTLSVTSAQAANFSISLGAPVPK